MDEGILQVAGYRTPDPLGFFFEKRALQVRTSQILDLIRWGLGTMMATVLVVAILTMLAIFSRVVDLRRLFGAGG